MKIKYIIAILLVVGFLYWFFVIRSRASEKMSAEDVIEQKLENSGQYIKFEIGKWPLKTGTVSFGMNGQLMQRPHTYGEYATDATPNVNITIKGEYAFCIVDKTTGGVKPRLTTEFIVLPVELSDEISNITTSNALIYKVVDWTAREIKATATNQPIEA